jgi:hypothetical protein
MKVVSGMTAVLIGTGKEADVLRSRPMADSFVSFDADQARTKDG